MCVRVHVCYARVQKRASDNPSLSFVPLSLSLYLKLTQLSGRQHAPINLLYPPHLELRLQAHARHMASYVSAEIPNSDLGDHAAFSLDH